MPGETLQSRSAARVAPAVEMTGSPRPGDVGGATRAMARGEQW
ncbi:MAG TPA: hypothetical protein VI248_26600 [Kineosporiaceae bacterium]